MVGREEKPRVELGVGELGVGECRAGLLTALKGFSKCQFSLTH